MFYIKQNIKCGIHSGFPKCCVYWYSFIMSPIMRIGEIFSERYWFKYPNIAWFIHKNVYFYNSVISRKISKIRNIYVEVKGHKIYTLNRCACPYCLFFGEKITPIRCDCYKNGK